MHLLNNLIQFYNAYQQPYVLVHLNTISIDHTVKMMSLTTMANGENV